MTKINRALNFGVLTAAIILAGCSSVADYQQPITDLNGAMDTSVMTIEKIDTELVTAQNKRWRELISQQQAFLLEAEDSCALGTMSCSLVVIEKGSSREQPFPATSVMPKAAEALSGLKSYTQALKAIVDADSATAVSAQVNAALANAVEIELQIAKVTGQSAPTSTIKAYSSPLSHSFSWLINKYVEREKIKALAAATKQAQPTIESLTKYYDTAASAAASLRAAAAHERFLTAQSRFTEATDKNATTVNEYLAAVKNYNIDLKAGSSRPMQQFLTAHTALNKALNKSPDISLVDAIAAIKSFKQHSEEFKGLVDEFIEVKKQQEVN